MKGIVKKLAGLLRLKSRLDRRARYARDIIELALPARPQVAQHQRQAALHADLAAEINWTGPSAWRGNR